MLNDLLELQAGLGRLFKRRVTQTDIAAFFGYGNAGAISGWFTGKNAHVSRENAAKLAAIMRMVRGEMPWPEGVGFELSARERNREVMTAWHAGDWARIEAEREAAKPAKIAAVSTTFQPRQFLKILDQIGEGQDSLARRMTTLEAAVNELLREWQGPKPATVPLLRP
jgi:hypothetical protein